MKRPSLQKAGVSLFKKYFTRFAEGVGVVKKIFVTDEEKKQASLIVPGKLLQPVLMFVAKAGATTLSIMTLSIMTLSIMTLSITTLSIMTPSIMTLSLMALSIMTLSILMLSV
jgi:hypothetical protein